MSASREKNKRKEQAAVPETSNEAKKGMSKGLKTTLTVVCAVLVVCIVVFFYMLTSGFFASHATAATVGSHKLTPAMVNYFYKNAYSSMQEQYGDFMSYILDTNSPLDEQTYDADTGETWADFFTQQGLTTAAEVYTIADEAKANGYTLSEVSVKEVLTDSAGRNVQPGDRLQILENQFTYAEQDGTQAICHINRYVKMQPGKEYYLFLRYSEENGYYVILSGLLGKVPVDESEAVLFPAAELTQLSPDAGAVEENSETKQLLERIREESIARYGAQ